MARRRTFVFIDGGSYSGSTSGSTGSTGGLLQVVQINIGDGTWNTPNVTGWFRFCTDNTNPITSITNSAGTNTNWSMGRGTASGFSEGPTTSTTAGYPSNVTHYGMANSSTSDFTLSGLSTSNKYTFDFFGSTLRNWENAAGQTTWTIGGTSQSILHRDYYGDKVTISNVTPNANGAIAISVSKNASATNWYMNSIVVKESSS